MFLEMNELMYLGGSFLLGGVVSFSLFRGRERKNRFQIMELEKTLSEQIREHKSFQMAHERQIDFQKQQLSELPSIRERCQSLGEELSSVSERNKALFEIKSEQAGIINELTDKYNELRAAYYKKERDLATLKISQEKREELYQEQLKQISETRESLTKEFENVANKIFEEKGVKFASTNEEKIIATLTPFREQMESFQKRVNEIHDASVRGNTSLKEEIKKVLDVGLKMNKEASNLTNALKGDSQKRGAWGEAQLRRTLEMSGFVEKTHFECQTSFKDDEHRVKQTDFLIKLPDNNNIIIDSKITLNAYDRVVSAKGDEEQQKAIKEHIRAVRRHVDDLASKEYAQLSGINSPSFVLLFMPLEPAYILALKEDAGLYEYAHKKGIILVSHTTLTPILHTISNLWMKAQSNNKVQEIVDQAGLLYNNICTLGEKLEKLGNNLGLASRQYKESLQSFTGPKGLFKRVEKFKDISEKASKQLPKFETKEIDFETAPLKAIALRYEKSEHLGNTDEMVQDVVVIKYKEKGGDVMH